MDCKEIMEIADNMDVEATAGKNIAEMEKEKADECLNFYDWGLRNDDREFCVGDSIPNSYNWYDGEMSDEELDGVCATQIVIANSREKQLKNIARALRINKVYYNEHLYLMRCDGDNSHIGEDEQEIIMCDAEVVAVIR